MYMKIFMAGIVVVVLFKGFFYPLMMLDGNKIENNKHSVANDIAWK